MPVTTAISTTATRTDGGSEYTAYIVDATNTDDRSRLVGQEFATYKDDALYASTPPLEALRIIILCAATGKTSWKTQVIICYVRRTCVYAAATHDLYI